MISSANDLLTRHDLGRSAALCNDGYDAVEGEYYLYENWHIQIRNGVEGHKEDKKSNYCTFDLNSLSGLWKSKFLLYFR